MKEVMMGTYFKGEESFNFNFYTDLSASNKVKFVNSVVNTLVEDDYNFIIKDLIFDYYIIKVFTDIDTSEIDESAMIINDIENLLEETNIVDVVKSNVKYELIDSLNDAVNKGIEYKTGIHINPLNDALANLVNTLDKKVNEYDLGDAMGIATKFLGMQEELTPEAVVNAYINSDIHKNNLEEIAEAKKAIINK